MIGGMWKDMRGQDIDFGFILHKGLRIKRRDFQRLLAFFTCCRDHFVFAAIEHFLPHVADISDILDMPHFVAEMHQRPPQPVGQHERAQIADVNEAIDRRPASVQPDLARLDRTEDFFSARERIVETQFHRVAPGPIRKTRSLSAAFIVSCSVQLIYFSVPAETARANDNRPRPSPLTTDRLVPDQDIPRPLTPAKYPTCRKSESPLVEPAAAHHGHPSETSNCAPKRRLGGFSRIDSPAQAGSQSALST